MQMKALWVMIWKKDSLDVQNLVRESTVNILQGLQMIYKEQLSGEVASSSNNPEDNNVDNSQRGFPEFTCFEDPFQDIQPVCFASSLQVFSSKYRVDIINKEWIFMFKKFLMIPFLSGKLGGAFGCLFVCTYTLNHMEWYQIFSMKDNFFSHTFESLISNNNWSNDFSLAIQV